MVVPRAEGVPPAIRTTAFTIIPHAERKQSPKLLRAVEKDCSAGFMQIPGTIPRAQDGIPVPARILDNIRTLCCAN